jgi:succinate-semialdehyde dehydrogenase/glutarate-semialdehyde dehydrogenase
MDGRLIIGNARIEAKEKIVSKSPATLEPLGEACLASSEQCRDAVRAAKDAFPLWRNLAHQEKEKIFIRAKKILLSRSREVVRLVTLEKGSPLAESMAVDVMGSLAVLDYYSRFLEKSLEPRKAKSQVPFFAHKKNTFHYQPLGVTLIISPWNFPFLIPIYDVVSALTAGNTVILRPSTSTPFCALMIGEILIEAGLPPGVLNIVNCRAAQAEEMITNPDVQTVMFTGSVAIGKRIMELASRNLTNTVLELGGKDPMIVLKDADLDRASQGAVWAAFMNSGQSCASIERVYVAKDIEEVFTARVLELTKRIKVGNPLEPGVDMGPMTVLSQLELVEEHIQDARQKGARVLFGGERIKDLPGYFIRPAVLTNVDHTMKIMTEETFGPVIPMMSFSDVEEAIALANDCHYGLTASVWTRDKKMAAALADRLEVGTVTVNDHMFSFTEPTAIWGGPKQTGMGRSHGRYGHLHLMNIKYVSQDFQKKKAQLWWFPYLTPKQEIMEKATVLIHHERKREKIKAALGLLRSWPYVRSTTSVRSLLKIAGRFFR